MCGFAVGTAFVHNGSTGGTDIVAAMASKKTNVSVGRMMLYTDVLIISSSFLLFHEIEKQYLVSWYCSLLHTLPIWL